MGVITLVRHGKIMFLTGILSCATKLSIATKLTTDAKLWTDAYQPNLELMHSNQIWDVNKDEWRWL